MSTTYFVLIREMRDAYNRRLRLVQSARQRGIKPTARLFPEVYYPASALTLPQLAY